MLRIVCTKFKLSLAIRSWNVTIILRLIRYVTLWPWPVTRWPWMLVVDLVSHGQCVYFDRLNGTRKYCNLGRNRGSREQVLSTATVAPQLPRQSCPYGPLMDPSYIFDINEQTAGGEGVKQDGAKHHNFSVCCANCVLDQQQTCVYDRPYTRAMTR